MFRCKVNGREVILRVSARLCDKDINRDKLYKHILSLGDRLLEFKDGHSFAVKTGSQSLIIADVTYGELVVITIQHIINQVFKTTN